MSYIIYLKNINDQLVLQTIWDNVFPKWKCKDIIDIA